jgi:hypothetical protein
VKQRTTGCLQGALQAFERRMSWRLYAVGLAIVLARMSLTIWAHA